MVDELASISLSCTWSSRFLQCFLDFKNTNQPETQDAYKETGMIQNFQDVQENRYRLALSYCFHSRIDAHLEVAKKTNLEAEVIESNLPAVALVCRGHPLAQQDSVTLSELHHYPMALFEDFEDADWIHILKTPSNQRLLYLFDRGAIVDAVTSGGYVSVTKQGAVLNDGIKSIVEIPISDLNDHFDIILLRRKTYELNRREREFVAYLTERLLEDV